MFAVVADARHAWHLLYKFIKNRYKDRMRRNHILFSSAFIMNLNTTMIGLALVYFLTDRYGLEAGLIGLFFALGYGAYLAGCTVFHRIEERVSPRISIPVAAAVIGLLSLALLLSPHFAGALAAMLLLQGTLGFFWPPLMGWVSSGLEGADLGRNLGAFNQSWSIGALTGPFVAGWLYALSPGIPFFTAAISLFLVTLILLLGNRFSKEMAWIKPVRESRGSEGKADQSTFLRFPSWVGVFSAYAVYGVLCNILPLEIRDVLGHGEQAAGNLLLVRGVVSLAGFTLLARFTRWHFRRFWILLVQLLTVLLILGALLLPSRLTVYGGFVLLFGLLFSASYSSSIFHGCSGALNRGGRMAIHEAVLTAGVASGSLLGGIFYQRGGITGAWTFLLILQLLGLAAMLLLRKSRAKVEA